MAHTAAPKSGQRTIPMLETKDPDAAPSRSRRHVAGLDEAEGSPPGVLTGLPMFRERPIEERVGRIRIAHEVVLDARILQRAVELVDVARRDAGVGTAEETEQWRTHAW